MAGEQWIALSIFGLTYLAIVSEKVHRTIAAGVGAALMIVTGILSQTQALATLDLNTLGLLFGMMVQVAVLKRSGFFEATGVYAAKLAGGKPWLILVSFCLLTAFFSAWLDNVTTVLVFAPLTIFVCRAVRLDPVPMLIAVILASNIGGTATLVGDPPNILIGSAVGIPFNEFLVNLAPIAAVSLGISLVYLHGRFKNYLRAPVDRAALAAMDPGAFLKDRRLMWISLAVLALTVGAFLLHGVLHLELATVAVSGAAVLLIVTKLDLHPVLHEVEWATLLLFAGLFIVVGGLEHVGLLKLLAGQVFAWTGNDIRLIALAVLWISAILSAVVDNIPFVVTMIPLVKEFAVLLHPEARDLADVIHGPDVMMLWWALALGACFGGNGTLFGASANLVTAGLAEQEGYRITFVRFLRIGVPVTFLSVLLSSAYLLLRYP